MKIHLFLFKSYILLEIQQHILFAHGICKEIMNDKMYSLLQYIQGGFGNNLVCERISSTVVKCTHYHTKQFVQLYVTIHVAMWHKRFKYQNITNTNSKALKSINVCLR